jgi:hypothetical protein
MDVRRVVVADPNVRIPIILPVHCFVTFVVPVLVLEPATLIPPDIRLTPQLGFVTFTLTLYTRAHPFFIAIIFPFNFAGEYDPNDLGLGVEKVIREVFTLCTHFTSPRL